MYLISSVHDSSDGTHGGNVALTVVAPPHVGEDGRVVVELELSHCLRYGRQWSACMGLKPGYEDSETQTERTMN